MIEWIFRTATVVVFVLMLIAALVTSGQCLGEGVTGWLASGLLSLAFTLFFCPWLDLKRNAAKTAPAVGSPPAI